MDTLNNDNLSNSKSTDVNDTFELENDPEFQKKPFWERIAIIGAQIPKEEWRKHFPRDFARNAEHYMYGVPRDEEE